MCVNRHVRGHKETTQNENIILLFVSSIKKYKIKQLNKT